MEKIFLTAIGVLAVAFLFDSLRSNSRKCGSPSRDTRDAEPTEPQSNMPLTADEAGPTQTGRFRVQQMLGSSGSPPTPSAAPIPGPQSAPEPLVIDTGDDEDTPLPGPFEK